MACLASFAQQGKTPISKKEGEFFPTCPVTPRELFSERTNFLILSVLLSPSLGHLLISGTLRCSCHVHRKENKHGYNEWNEMISRKNGVHRERRKKMYRHERGGESFTAREFTLRKRSTKVSSSNCAVPPPSPLRPRSLVRLLPRRLNLPGSKASGRPSESKEEEQGEDRRGAT